jgi:hypothetical protein
LGRCDGGGGGMLRVLLGPLLPEPLLPELLLFEMLPGTGGKPPSGT